MLVLNRKNGDEIRIGNNIIIKIVSAGSNGVKIGIDAPGDVQILRGELYDNVKENILRASENSTKQPKDPGQLKINKLKK